MGGRNKYIYLQIITLEMYSASAGMTIKSHTVTVVSYGL